MCKVKGVVHTDYPTDNYHLTLQIISTEHLNVFHFIVLVLWSATLQFSFTGSVLMLCSTLSPAAGSCLQQKKKSSDHQRYLPSTNWLTDKVND